MKHIYLTEEGFEKLKSELKDLKLRRPQLVKHLDEARQLGDLRENAEYHSTKEALTKLHKRIFDLEEKINNTRVIEKNKISKNKILLGSTATLKNIDSGDEVVYQLVDPEEVDVDAGKISAHSPIGEGLLEKKVGDTAEIKVPAGTIRFKILKIG